MMHRSRTIHRLLLGLLGACLAGAAAWITPAPWNWIPFVAIAGLALRDLIVQRSGLNRDRGRGLERRLALGLTMVMVLLSLGVRRINDAMQAPTTWPDLLKNAAGCGVEQRCYLEIDGFEADSKRSLEGKFLVTGLRDDGIALDGTERHWWAHPDAARLDHFRHVVPETFQLSLGDRMQTRTFQPSVEGLTVLEIGNGLIAAAGAAPDPTTLPPGLAWQSIDIRISGECVLKQPLPRGFKVMSERLCVQGNHVTFDFATLSDLSRSGVDLPVQRSSIRVTWPEAIPLPDLKARQLMDHMLG